MEAFCKQYEIGSSSTSAILKPSWLRDQQALTAFDAGYLLGNTGTLVPLLFGILVLFTFVFATLLTSCKFCRASIYCQWRQVDRTRRISGLKWGTAGVIITVCSGVGLLFASQASTKFQNFQCGTLTVLGKLEDSRTNWRGARDVVSDLEYLISKIPTVKANAAQYVTASSTLSAEFASHLTAVDERRSTLATNQRWPTGDFGHQCMFCTEVLYQWERYAHTLRTGFLGKLLEIRNRINVDVVSADLLSGLQQKLKKATENMQFIQVAKENYGGLALLSASTKSIIDLYLMMTLITVTASFGVLLFTLAFMYWLGAHSNINHVLQGIDEQADGDLEHMSVPPHSYDDSTAFTADSPTKKHHRVGAVIHLLWTCQGVGAVALLLLGGLSIAAAFIVQDICLVVDQALFSSGTFLHPCRAGSSGERRIAVGMESEKWTTISWAYLGAMEKELAVDYFDDLVEESVNGNRLAAHEFVYTTDLVPAAIKKSSCSLTRDPYGDIADMPRYLDTLNGMSAQYRYVFASTPNECVPLQFEIGCDVITSVVPTDSIVQQRHDITAPTLLVFRLARSKEMFYLEKKNNMTYPDWVRTQVAGMNDIHAPFVLAVARDQGIISSQAKAAMKDVLERQKLLSQTNCSWVSDDFAQNILPLCNEDHGFTGLLLSGGMFLWLSGLTYTCLLRATFKMWRRSVFRRDTGMQWGSAKVVPA